VRTVGAAVARSEVHVFAAPRSPRPASRGGSSVRHRHERLRAELTAPPYAKSNQGHDARATSRLGHRSITSRLHALAPNRFTDF
jgi:hypothetical protein